MCQPLRRDCCQSKASNGAVDAASGPSRFPLDSSSARPALCSFISQSAAIAHIPKTIGLIRGTGLLPPSAVES